VITNLYIQNVKSPSPNAFTFVSIKVGDTPEAKGDWGVAFQNFLYDNPDSPKFGGGVLGGKLYGIYLGPTEEAVKTFIGAGLMDPNLVDQVGTSLVTKDYEVVELNILPQGNIKLHEVKTFAGMTTFSW
jgi:hypothetical protein